MNSEVAISILSTLILSGVVLILFEHLRINETTITRVSLKIKPLIHKLTCLTRIIYWMDQCISSKDPSMEYNQKFQKTLQEFTTRVNSKILAGQDIDFCTINDIMYLCEQSNQVWYILSEKRNQLVPYITFSKQSYLLCKSAITPDLRQLEIEHCNYECKLSILAEVSSRFYHQDYQPIVPYLTTYKTLLSKVTHLNHLIYKFILVGIAELCIIYIFSDTLCPIIYTFFTLTYSLGFLGLLRKYIQLSEAYIKHSL